MGLTFCNHSSTQVSVAIMFLSPDTCSGEGGDWEMQGWWNISPGSCALVYANDLEDLNQYWFFFAHSHELIWQGNGTWTASVPTARFDRCYGGGVNAADSSEFELLDFARLDIGDNDDYTVNLTD